VIWAYLAEARRMIAASEMYEVLSHIDYAVRYWPAQQEGPFNPRIFEDAFRQVMRDLAGSGKALELNVGGPLRPWIPQWWSEEGGHAITFASDAHTALKRHRVQAATEAAKRGGSIGPEDLVFTSSIGTPLEPRNANRVFTDLLKTAGLRPTRFHDLRHTCASLLLAQGGSPRVVMETLGHSAIAVTMNTYGHVMPLAQREAADRMNELFV
jgi:hypothetical protein